MPSVRNIVILTGAGISAESGLQTFRETDGRWENHSVEDVATPRAFERDPDLVQRFHDERRATLFAVMPNPAHDALARLDAEWKGEFLLVTQNVDDLHERAGAKRLVHMHGELRRARCLACEASVEWKAPLVGSPTCPVCNAAGRLRPDVVWSGEAPLHMDKIASALANADLFVSIGNSGRLDSAARFVEAARAGGARTLEIDLEPSEIACLFHERRAGRASQLVPVWVREALAAAA